MVPPQKLIGLSRRRRRHSPKPESPVGYMWSKKGVVRIDEVQRQHRMELNWYDAQPAHIRQLIQEQGLQGLSHKQLMEAARHQLMSQLYVPSMLFDYTQPKFIDAYRPNYPGGVIKWEDMV